MRPAWRRRRTAASRVRTDSVARTAAAIPSRAQAGRGSARSSAEASGGTARLRSPRTPRPGQATSPARAQTSYRINRLPGAELADGHIGNINRQWLARHPAFRRVPPQPRNVPDVDLLSVAQV